MYSTHTAKNWKILLFVGTIVKLVTFLGVLIIVLQCRREINTCEFFQARGLITPPPPEVLPLVIEY